MSIKRYIVLVIFFMTFSYSIDIPISKVELREFGKIIKVNGKVIQQNNTKQSFMSVLGGQIDAYYVKEGDFVEKGQKIVKIKSIELSKLTSKFLLLKDKLVNIEENYQLSRTLYNKGAISKLELNSIGIEYNSIKSEIESVKSQLKILNINTDKLTKILSSYVLYAHSNGRVSSIFIPLHSIVGNETLILNIVKNSALYLKSYIPIKYASLINIGQKIIINRVNNKNISTKVVQISPTIDEKTQRLIVFSLIEDKDIFINEYVEASVYLQADNKYLSIRKSALSFFENEWVVYIPKEHDEHDDHDEHESRDEHEERHDENITHEQHDEHEEDDEVPYEIKIIKIITQDDNYVAVDGITLGEEYVSDKSYYVKSLLLKSSLGGHGH